MQAMRRRSFSGRGYDNHLLHAYRRQLVKQAAHRRRPIAGAVCLALPVALRRKRQQMWLRHHRHTHRAGQHIERLAPANSGEIDQVARPFRPNARRAAIAVKKPLTPRFRH